MGREGDGTVLEKGSRVNCCQVMVFSLKVVCGASPGSPAGMVWQRECRSRPGKDGGVQNPFAFYFVTYSRIKSEHFIVSGTVRVYVLVRNTAAFILDLSLWSVMQPSSAFLQWPSA